MSIYELEDDIPREILEEACQGLHARTVRGGPRNANLLARKKCPLSSLSSRSRQHSV